MKTVRSMTDHSGGIYACKVPTHFYGHTSFDFINENWNVTGIKVRLQRYSTETLTLPLCTPAATYVRISRDHEESCSAGTKTMNAVQT